MRSWRVESLAVSVVSLVFSKSIEPCFITAEQGGVAKGLNGMIWALRELGPRLIKFKSLKCGSRELEICTNSQLISRSASQALVPF